MLNEFMMPQSVQDIYKVDLHVHLQALADEDLMREFAQKRGLDMAALAPGYFRQNWGSLENFHNEYEGFYGKLHKEPEDYYRAIKKYLLRVAKQNTIYVELSGSLRPPAPGKISNDELLTAVGQAFRDAKQETGIEARFIASTVRDFGSRQALWVAREAIRLREEFPFIVGFGMSGDENYAEPLMNYVPAYKLARHFGLLCTMHAGETNVKTLAEAVLVMTPYLDRIGHGITALDHPEILDSYVRKHRHRGEFAHPDKHHCVLEICLTSNVKLGGCKSYAEHPIKKLWDNKYRITLGSDDPGPMQTDIGTEYQLAHEQCGLSLMQLAGISSAAIKYSGLADKDKAPLLAKTRAQKYALQGKSFLVHEGLTGINGASPAP